VQDPQIYISALLKLVGGSHRLIDDLNTEEFTKQADLYEDMSDDLLSLYYKFLMVRWQTHPFPALRAREIKEWAETEQFRRILRGDYPRSRSESGVRACAQCGARVINVTFRFCPECGAPIDVPAGTKPG
ncbi:MAG TPA: hypothetical protein VGS41_10255, partial [Chthonomonadales bacterium]|nr:hypothetical protein [Chthonomonadales bacterium]